MMKAKGLLLIALSSLILQANPTIKRTQMMMGTFITISVEPSKMALIPQAFKRMKAVEMALSSYDEKAQIYKLNHNRESAINHYTYEALNLSKRYYEESHGSFDISIGSITKELYHFGDNESLPQNEALQKAVVNLNGIYFDKNRAWLDAGVTVDLGGMGKGYGVDKVASLLRTYEVKNAQIIASGDIKCFKRCEINIKNPFGEGSVASFTTQYDYTAISTSGNYERYVKSKKYNHLINPSKKSSARTFASITLVATQANADLDAYATAASVMSYEDAIRFLQERKVWYLLITVDGAITYKPSEKYIKNLRIFKT